MKEFVLTYFSKQNLFFRKHFFEKGVRVVIFFLLLFPLFSFSQTPEEIFAKANEQYTQKKFTEAIQLYDSILKMGYASPELYFNLGNAHYKTGRLAPAILNYERAKKIDPTDDDITHNLKLANLRVVDRVEEVPELFFLRWAKDLIILRSSNGWARLAIIALWVALGLAALFIFSNNLLLKRTGFFAALFAFLISLLFVYLAYTQYNYERSSNAAIVFVKNVYVKSSPDAQSTDLFILREGVKVNVMEEQGGWQKIQLADEKVGWIKSEALEMI